MKRYTPYWQEKIKRNRERDFEQTIMLENDGWVVIRVWESEIKKDITSIVDMVERVYRERKKYCGRKRVVVSLKKGNFDDEFSVLMRKVNDWLNTDATNRPDYYRKVMEIL